MNFRTCRTWGDLLELLTTEVSFLSYWLTIVSKLSFLLTEVSYWSFWLAEVSYLSYWGRCFELLGCVFWVTYWGKGWDLIVITPQLQQTGQVPNHIRLLKNKTTYNYQTCSHKSQQDIISENLVSVTDQFCKLIVSDVQPLKCSQHGKRLG